MSPSRDSRDAIAADRWQHIQALLADVIDCPAAQRDALIDCRCGGDSSLRNEIESLLNAHEREGLVDRLTPLLTPACAWLRHPLNEWSGQRIAQYHVEEPIGSGGMAVVYRARDEQLGRRVALKFLSPVLSADAAARSRLLTEGRTAAALEHPNVCTIYEIGQTADGYLFIAMPLYDGETLQARLKRGRCTFAEAVPIVMQIARALEHAHGLGIVHRDVKPSNVMVLPDGTAKIVDFGIARLHDAAGTDPQTLVGTAPYMSPEQATGGTIDCRSDIWSFGIVLHEVLTGAPPFHGDDVGAVLDAIRHQDPELHATSYPDVPAGIDRILRRALAKSPDERYTSMSLVAADLSALAAEALGDQTRVSADDPLRMSTTERRRAAVLVTVVSDYASLVEQMTPVEGHRLIGRLRDVAVDVVREYGGLVNQAIGDQIVSLFGVPVAHEDDDVRAVRAALELHARVRALERADCPPDVTLRVQSGLHVGAVVARRLDEGPRRFDIAGTPAAIAARLAVLADADDIWVAPETQRLICPYMQTAPCTMVVLDTQAGPVMPFRVLGETGIATRLESASGAGLTPYVGRHSELSVLQSHVARAARGLGAVVAIVGEAGAGKSRLLHELRTSLRADAGVRVLHARCSAYGDRVPYGVFVQILCAALDLRPPLTSADVAARIRAADAALEPFLPLFLHLLSVSGDGQDVPRHLRGEHLQAALLDAVAALIAAQTRRGPLVLLIEDWHWADAGSRAAFMRVAELPSSSPLVVIVTSRDTHNAPGQWPGHTSMVRLDRLDFDASVAIVQAVLGSAVSDALAHQLYDRAGGNPFFLEQTCTALIEQRALTVRDGFAQVDGALVLPDTVQGVIRARLDNLDAQARELVRVASVIGREFDHALLVEIAPTTVDPRPAIDALQSAGLIQQTSQAPTIVYRFTHALTQEVCYDSLVGHQRKVLHGAIGRALVFMHADRLDEWAALLAYHFGQAEDWPVAIRFGRHAAERAIAMSQFADALATLDQALDWARRQSGGATDLTADLLLQQERVCETLGLRARQQQIIDSLIALLARDGRSTRLAEVYLRQGDLSTLLKRFDAADRALTTALRIGNERGDTTVLRSALRSLGLLRWHEGRHAEALEITQRALAVDRDCGDDVAVAVDLPNLGCILKALGDYPRARTTLEEALAMPVLRSDPKKLVYAQHNLANVYREMGDLDRALACLLQNDEIARTHLLPIQRSFHLTSIAHIQLQQGRVSAAVETYRDAVDLSRRARHAEGLVQSLRMLGNVLVGLARYDEALPCLREAAELFAQLADHVSEAEMRSAVARILERTSPQDAAETWSVVLTLQRTLGDSRGELDAREGLARAMRASGSGEAIPALESALALATTIGDGARELAIRNMLGILEWERGGFAAALTHYDAALALARAQGNRAHEALILNSLGVSLTHLVRPEEARTVLEESLALSREIGAGQLEAHALAALGQIALQAHDLRVAAEWFEQSRAVRASIGDRAGEGWMYLRLAEIRNRCGEPAAALDATRTAAAAAAESGDDRLARSVRNACTQAF